MPAQNWQLLQGQDPGSPGQWGGGAFAMVYRDPLDAARAARRDRIPIAEYPDGYLGTIQSRREDRLLKNLSGRMNERNYQRGVHKGERIDPSDYFWPEGGPVDPEAGLRAQARGGRWTAQGGTSVERFVAGGQYARQAGRELLGPIDSPEVVDPQRVQGLRQLLPAWGGGAIVGPRV